MKFFAPIFVALLLNLPTAAFADEELFKLINQRLELMQSVAAHKWVHKIAIEDKAREKIVIQRARQSALKLGLVPDSAEAFFVAQIEAAKDIQNYWFNQWNDDNAPADAPDLSSEIRPKLLALGEQITVSLHSQQELAEAEIFNSEVSVQGLSPQSKDKLYQALKNIKRYNNRLQQILDTGILRIGTTGDYAPFSFWADNQNKPRGTDIDRGESLAQSLGVKPVFIKTSWPTLTQDLLAGNFDIAMSGVSLTKARAAFGFFSSPYHVGGKTAIARCKDADKFKSLDAIDQPSVRVIVNPGGTNEKFVDKNIKLATKVLHMDNRSIFSQLVRGRADVMITDRIEVDLQSSLHSKLCSTTSENFTYQEKAYWMPKELDLKQRVDSWLSETIDEKPSQPNTAGSN